ncbi:DUF1566 domain-containing protein [Thermodesulfobacteriota bacterium]
MAFRKSFKLALPILLVFLLAGLAGIGISALQKKNSETMKYNHAFLIGINNYDHWSALKSPIKDVETVAKILVDKYDFKKENITLLTDNTTDKPTEETILDYLDKYIGELTEKDNLLIFFSGRSAEDDEGETYWVPKDGRKRKRRWLGHTDLSEVYFGAKDFKAKSVCLLTDSPFSSKLIKDAPNPHNPNDLRYPDRITERASKKSREVISFGDEHWSGSKDTNGLGLFAYYIHKALDDNALKIIDFENLIFDENILIPIRNIAGTRLIRGRLRESTDADGQFIITKLTPTNPVDVVNAYVNPSKGYAGDNFTFEAQTSSPTYEVYIEIDGQKRLMRGEGNKFNYSAKVNKPGAVSFKITAINEDNLPGKSKQGQLTVIQRAAAVANVVKAQVVPQEGLEGDEFTFRAMTDAPANKVAVRIKGKQFEMEGSDTQWFLNRPITEIGTLDYSIIATNPDGLSGLAQSGKIQVGATLVNVVDVKPAPTSGFAGDEFTITAMTDRGASEVLLQLDGTVYPMEGTGKTWQFKEKIEGIGKKQFTVIAKNVQGKEGTSKSGELLTKKKPLAVPNVAAVDVNVLAPGKGYAGDSYVIKVKTSTPSDVTFVEIDGKQYAMEGSGTEWNYIAKIDRVGASKYMVIAKNKDGVQGTSKSGEILTKKRPLPIPDVAAVTVNPKKVYQGDSFSISVKTSAPSDKVLVEIDGQKIAMQGADTQWNTTAQVDNIGTSKITVIAQNKDGKQGKTKDGSIIIAKRPAKSIDVITAQITPAKGLQGDEFTITATTSGTAQSAAVILEGKSYKMTGSGTEWSLKKKIEDVGPLSYSVVATNDDGVAGGSKIGNVLVNARLVDVVSVEPAPKTGYAGEDFTITAMTNLPAKAVSLKMDGLIYEMKGSGKKWQLKRKIPDIGKKEYTVIAQNIEDKEGRSKSGEILTEKKPVVIPDVASIDVTPKAGFEGDNFVITAKTNLPANAVSLQMDGVTYAMKGSGNTWRFERKIPDIGKKQFTIIAKNEEGNEGTSKSGEIVTEKRALAVPDIASVDVSVVSPGQGYVGDSFDIKVKTTAPSDAAFIEIEGKRFPMKGADTDWNYVARIDKLGASKYTVTASNKEGEQGKPREGEIITATKAAELVNVVQAVVKPEKGATGGKFTFTATTDSPAKEVTLALGDKQYTMTGAGTQWSFSTKLTKIGTQNFSIIPKNQDDVEGGIRTASVTVEKLKIRYRRNPDSTLTDVVTGEVKDRLQDNGDGTVTDLLTGLMWLQQPKQIATNYEGAVEYCRALEHQGLTGWRLPTVQEFRQIIARKQENPALPAGHPFSSVLTHIGYWTKTKHTKFGPQYVYQMNMWFGKDTHLKKTADGIVWPVRYAEIPKG